ncbi:hypothetical protein K501DRAFT_331672 [Backusella circina FSU 941]|nr:hypothetical protein K501DRAFT_331672 [Backusella circina FSU 941]
METVRDFWLFIICCLVVIAVVLFFLFYFNRTLALILSFLINQYTWRHHNAYVEIESIRVTLLGGRILFKNLKYTSTNVSVSIVKGHIALQYWLSDVRKTEQNKQDTKIELPCRIVCDVEGLECFIYNNAPAYSRIKDILGFSTKEVGGQQPEEVVRSGSIDPESQAPTTSSFLEKILPLQFDCTKGSVIVGNSELKTMLVATFSQANGIYAIKKSRSPMDIYKTEIEVVIRKPYVSVKDNIDFIDLDVVDQQVHDQSWLGYFSKYIQYLISFKKRRDRHRREGVKEKIKSKIFQKSNKEYARVDNLLECNEAALTYYADYAGPVPRVSGGFPGPGLDVGNGGLPPEWGIKILVWDPNVNYGPWMDKQRGALQDYFFPNPHRTNLPTTRLVPGQQRIATQFETYIEIVNTGKLRIPIREASKDWKYMTKTTNDGVEFDDQSRSPGWVDLKAGSGSVIKVTTPFVIGPEGATNLVDINVKDIEATTSVNYASVLQSPKAEVQIKMPAPLKWNGSRKWTFNINVRKPTVFLLRDHIFLAQDLIKDWTSGPPGDLLYFTPILYELNFNLNHTTAYLYVNEHNVINNPNSIDDNAFIKAQISKASVTLTIPSTEFQPNTNAIKFNIAAENISAGLSVQSSHTLKAFMREEDSNVAVIRSVILDGSYENYSTVDIMRHIESCNLHFKINGVTVKLFGSVIRYVLILKDNYFGAWSNFSTIDEHRRYKQNYGEFLEQKQKKQDAKGESDPFEVYLLLELDDGVLLLPENLYDYSRYTQVELQELQLELRNLDPYLDLYITSSPLTISRDNSSSLQTRDSFYRTRIARDTKNFLYIDSLNIYAHRLCGPAPQCSTYVCHWDFDVGKISGEIKPSFLLGIASFGQTFAYNMIDEDNAVPQKLESNDLPDVTFLKFHIQEIDVCLMSMTSATNINLENGILLELDNLINEKYTNRISLKIPTIVTRCLANPDISTNAENEYPWVEVAKVDLGLNMTLFRQTSKWRLAREDQQNFLRTQDEITRRCVRLYESDDSASQTSRSTSASVNDHLIGVIYAPPYRVFMSGKVDDKSSMHDSSSVTTERQERYRGYSSSSLRGSISEIIYTDDSQGEEDSSSDYDTNSVRSLNSRDNESFYTAAGSEDGYRNYPSPIPFFQHNYESDTGSEVEYDSSSMEESIVDEREEEMSSAIPQSIPYSDYLRRFRIDKKPNHHHSFFHEFAPPVRRSFVPEKKIKEGSRPVSGYDLDEDFTSNQETTLVISEHEAIMTVVVEATRSISILVTPILVKIVQEIAEDIIKDDWNLESMMDSIQMEYVEQLTKFLTTQYNSTRFAVILPETYIHFIQNATMPDGISSYKHGESFNDSNSNNAHEGILCSAELLLKDTRLMGAVKFEDVAFGERKKKISESDMKLRELRIDLGIRHIGSTVQYISKRQTPTFGIPHEVLQTRSLFSVAEDDPNEIVMLDICLDGLSIEACAPKTPTYLSVKLDKFDTIMITEAVEVLFGAVYSWLNFVDDLKQILENFKERRSRQVKMFMNTIAEFSVSSAVVGDPIFLSAPRTMLRLGSKHFRNDTGWKLIARMRHCLRSMPSTVRNSFQNQLTAGADSEVVSAEMYSNIIRIFKRWRSWELDPNEVQKCRLFTQAFDVGMHDQVQTNQTEEIVQYLVSSSNFVKLKLKEFKFCIYEEELDVNANTLIIRPIKLSAECLYKSSVVERSSVHEGYLDMVASAFVGEIDISINPYILAFAQHMLMVKRVFSAKLATLSHTNSASSTPASDIQGFSIDTLLSSVDVVSQLLIDIDCINLNAFTQKLKMESKVSGIHGSGIFSNPKLAPLQLSSQVELVDSDTGSGKRSSHRSRKTGLESRLVFEASGGIHGIQVRFIEELSQRTLFGLGLETVNLNTNIAQVTKVAKKTSENKEILNIFANVQKFSIHVPQSLLRLYGFIDEWQMEQGKRYHFMFQKLVKEWEEQRRGGDAIIQTDTPKKKMDLKLQFLMNEFWINADLLPSLTARYEMNDMFIMYQQLQQPSTSPVHTYTFQLSKQMVHLITKHETSSNSFNIPGIRSTGSVKENIDHLELKSMISVEFISMPLDVGLIDSLLTAQSLVGNEISELVEVVSYSAKSKKNPAPSSSHLASTSAQEMEKKPLKHSINVKLNGLCISASSPSAVCVFRSNLIDVSLSNHINDELNWKVQASDFSLSLEHKTMQMITDQDYRRHSLAYILIDFSIQSYLPVCTEENCKKDTHAHEPVASAFYVDISKIQTVMQPIALGKLAEVIVFYGTELKSRKLLKKAEIDQLTDNTKRIVQSVKSSGNNDMKSTEEEHPLLEGKTLSLRIRQLGVAIPLESSSDDPLASTTSGSTLFFSIHSIEFLTKSIERGALYLDRITLQFVRTFDQNNQEHFISDHHPQMNQIHVPFVSCIVSGLNDKPVQYIKADAQVGGFEIDVDGTISDYFNSLSRIYARSMDRFDELTAKADFLSPPSSSVSSSEPGAISSQAAALDIECKFDSAAGTIRMYPKRYATEQKRKPSLVHKSDHALVSSNMAVLHIPGLGAWATYQVPLGNRASLVKRFHADILIRESNNILHPSLVQFLREVISGLKLGMQQSSERKVSHENKLDPSINASLFLRLSKTKVDLSCQPLSMVVCSVGWEESEFMMNAFSNDATSRTMSLVGSLRDISLDLKHQFSPETCLSARIEKILFNAMMTSQRRQEGSKDDSSILVELPVIQGDLNMLHFQDLLTLKSYWFDQPILPESVVAASSNQVVLLEIPGSSSSSSATTSATSAAAPFSKHITICLNEMRFSVDLGRAIGKIIFAPNNLSLQMHHIPFESRGLYVLLDDILIESEGRFSGTATFKQTLLQVQQTHSDTNICVRSYGLSAMFEYESQNLLHVVQQVLEFKVDLKQQDAAAQDGLSISADLDALIVRLSIRTVPVIITMVQKFNELLKRKKEEAAGVRPAFTKRHQQQYTKKEIADSGAKKKENDRYIKATIVSSVTVGIQKVEVVIYPHQFHDSDNIDMRASDFKVELNGYPREETGIKRKLVIRLDHAALAKNVPGKELVDRYSSPELLTTPKPKNMGGTKIFGVPSTTISMESIQQEQKVDYDFGADFGGRIGVSLNLGLIRYLQELYKRFEDQLEHAKNKTTMEPLSEPATPASTMTNQTEMDFDSSISRVPVQHPYSSSSSSSAEATTPSVERGETSLEKAVKYTEITSKEALVPSSSLTSPEATATAASAAAGPSELKKEQEPKKEEKEEKYKYHPKNQVNFYPQLQIMGDATPPVDWLGLKREKIPGLIHENITLHLDQLVKILWEILESQSI